MFSTFQMLWAEREPREKLLLSIMATILSAVIFWQFILSPVLSAKSEANSALLRAERDYMTVSKAIPSLSSSGATSTQRFNQAILIEAASQRGLNVSRVQPDGNKSLSVWIDTQDTTAFYTMLNDVITKNGAILSRATLSTSANQTLSAQLTFELTP